MMLTGISQSLSTATADPDMSVQIPDFRIQVKKRSESEIENQESGIRNQESIVSTPVSAALLQNSARNAD